MPMRAHSGWHQAHDGIRGADPGRIAKLDINTIPVFHGP